MELKQIELTMNLDFQRIENHRHAYDQDEEIHKMPRYDF